MTVQAISSRLVLSLLITAVGCSNSTTTADAGHTVTDSGTVTDTGTTVTDTGTTVADTGPAFNVVNGCTAAMYTDLSAAGATRTVNFGVAGALTYTPACATIAAGQTVTFAGTFSVHPLTPGVPPGQTGTASPNNPITLTNSGSSTTVTFSTPGFYPYYCGVHFSLGMVGAIQVM